MSKKVTYDEFVQLLDRKGKITFIWPDSKEFNIWKNLAEVEGKPVKFLANDNHQYDYYVYLKDFKTIDEYFIKNNYYEMYDDNTTAILNQDGINFINNNPPFKIFQEFYDQIYAQPEGKIDTFKTAVAPYGNSYKSYLLGEEYFIDLENAIRYTNDKYVEILDDFEDEDIEKITSDIVYKVNEADKLKLDDMIDDNNWSELTIYTVDTRVPIIKLIKKDESNKNTEGFIFLVDIKDEDEFKYKTTIKNKKDLNKAIDLVLDAFNDHDTFYKYVDDIENLKM